MSTEAGAIQREKAFSLADVPAWLWLGIGVYALVLIGGQALLNDSDTYWQIAVGQWILDHHALPRVDIYSFTKAGEPWTSSSWLAQVLYATSYNLAGWAGPVVLAASCIAATFALVHAYSRAAVSLRPMRSPSRWWRWRFRWDIFWRVRMCWCCRSWLRGRTG